MPISLKAAQGVAGSATAYGGLKSSIALFDINPGTRTWTVPAGVSRIRVFVVGGGGGGDTRTTTPASGAGGGFSEKIIDVTPGQVFSYTVADGGASGDSSASPLPTAGGTSAFAGIISATGGAPGWQTGTAAGGTGVGGDINRTGGSGFRAASGNAGGGSAATAFGDGRASESGFGAGFSRGAFGYVDGWDIGLLPGVLPSNYGCGSQSVSATSGAQQVAGYGGGGAGNGTAGPSAVSGGHGGGGAGAGNLGARGGNGLVGIEVIE